MGMGAYAGDTLVGLASSSTCPQPSPPLWLRPPRLQPSLAPALAPIPAAAAPEPTVSPAAADLLSCAACP